MVEAPRGLSASQTLQVFLASAGDGGAEAGDQSQVEGRRRGFGSMRRSPRGRHPDVSRAASGWEAGGQRPGPSLDKLCDGTAHVPSLGLSFSLLKVKYAGHSSLL